jgi:DNA repair protein RadA/Sms
LAIASAARGVPVLEGLAAFGEIGLTGRLRQAAQAERRVEECAKLGIELVVAPGGVSERARPRLAAADTLRAALRAALQRKIEDAAA